MEPFKQSSYGKNSPEAKVQRSIIRYLRFREWYVMETHGNMYQRGFPDLFACHTRYGQRWIEVKLPKMKGSRFTPAQLECFPKLCAHGSGVWIMTAGSDAEYEKLTKPANWYVYLSTWKGGHKD